MQWVDRGLVSLWKCLDCGAEEYNHSDIRRLNHKWKGGDTKCR
jgi:hypothetical protein